MTPETWRRARSILAAALDAPPERRRVVVAQRCGDDRTLRHEVESLLDGTSAELAIHAPSQDSQPDPPGVPAPTEVTPGDRPDDMVVAIEGGPRLWGEFLLLHELGRGGFGVVYRAWDPTLQRDVALKVIDLRRLPRRRGDMLLREGQMLARVNHPNVVTVFGVQRRGADVGLAMEYIRGQTLAEQLSSTGPLSGDQVSRIGATLCLALTEVHRMGLVHRDIKAANVMHERGGRIVLMDFGAGHEVVGDTAQASVVVGTPAYMSPEVLSGLAATPASDVYSLGVLLFHLMTAAYPPGPLGREEGRRSISVAAALASLRPGLPAPLIEAVTEALEPDRHRRPTPASLRRMLERVTTTSRRRRTPRRSRPVERAQTSSLGWQTWVRAAVAGLVGVVLLCTLVGFVTTVEFNYVLGRTGGFAQESWLAYPYWGARAMFVPAITVGLLLLGLNAVSLVARLALASAPARWRVLDRGGTFMQRVRDAGLTDPRTRCEGVCVLGAVAFGLILAAFAPLFDGYMSRIDTSPVSALATLAPDNQEIHTDFRQALTVLLFFLGGQLLHSLRTAGRDREAGLMRGIAGIAVLIVFVLTTQAAPWRTVYHSKFRKVEWAGQHCFVLGANGDEMLLHCPGVAAPRNRIVAADASLVLLEADSNLLQAYAPPQSFPSQLSLLSGEVSHGWSPVRIPVHSTAVRAARALPGFRQQVVGVAGRIERSRPLQREAVGRRDRLQR